MECKRRGRSARTGWALKKGRQASTARTPLVPLAGPEGDQARSEIAQRMPGYADGFCGLGCAYMETGWFAQAEPSRAGKFAVKSAKFSPTVGPPSAKLPRGRAERIIHSVAFPGQSLSKRRALSPRTTGARLESPALDRPDQRTASPDHLLPNPSFSHRTYFVL
jgi:hypothetical protein